MKIISKLDENDFTSKHKRLIELDELTDKNNTSGEFAENIEFQGRYLAYSTFNIPIKHLLYNTNNGRTKTLQRSYIKENGLADDFFMNWEQLDVQIAQHSILEKFLSSNVELGVQENLMNDGQKEALICSHEGVVWSGNRRLAIMRNLHKTGKKDFSNIRIVRLPKCNIQDLYDFERSQEMAKDVKVAFPWHSKAYQIRDQFKLPDVDEKRILKSMQWTKKEMEENLQMLEIGEEYLKKINKDDRYELLANVFQPLKNASQHLLKIKDNEKKEFYKQQVFEILLFSEEQMKGKRRDLLVNSVFKNLEKNFSKYAKEDTGKKNPLTGKPIVKPPNSKPLTPEQIARDDKIRKDSEELDKFYKKLDSISQNLVSLESNYSRFANKVNKQAINISMDKITKSLKHLKEEIKNHNG